MARLRFACAVLAAVAMLAVVSAQTFTPGLSNSFSTKYATYSSVFPGAGTGNMYCDYEAGLILTELNLLGMQNIGYTVNKTTYSYIKGETCQAQAQPMDPLPAFWWLPWASPAGTDETHHCQKFALDLHLFDIQVTACLASATQLNYLNVSSSESLLNMDIVFHNWDNKAPPRSVFQLPSACRNVPIQPPPPFPFVAEAGRSTSVAAPAVLLARLAEKAQAGDKSARDQMISLFTPIPFRR